MKATLTYDGGQRKGGQGNFRPRCGDGDGEDETLKLTLFFLALQFGIYDSHWVCETLL